MKHRIQDSRFKIQVVCFVVVIATALFVAASAHAVDLESGIPGVGAAGAKGQPLPDLATYINYLYIFVLGFVGIAGFVSLIVWGTVWVASAVVDKKAMALENIKNTLIGIGIALTAFIMLNTINPDLTRIKIPAITPIVISKTPSASSLISGAPGSLADGARCASSASCYPGSTCINTIKDSAGVVTSMGQCARITDPSNWETTCSTNDSDSTSCINTGCKYCTMPDNSSRCINKINSYNNPCTL